MKPGDFRATCRKWQTDGNRCDETFTAYADLEAHMKSAHPATYAANRLQEPKMIRPRRVPFGRPVVRLENQAIPPGTRFVHEGRDCQVIGAASATRTRFLVWLPSDTDPARKGARRHYEMGPDENGMWVWELTAPTEKVAAAVAASN